MSKIKRIYYYLLSKWYSHLERKYSILSFTYRNKWITCDNECKRLKGLN